MERPAQGAARPPGRRPPAAAAHRHQQNRCKEGLDAGSVACCISCNAAIMHPASASPLCAVHVTLWAFSFRELTCVQTLPGTCMGAQ